MQGYPPRWRLDRGIHDSFLCFLRASGLQSQRCTSVSRTRSNSFLADSCKYEHESCNNSRSPSPATCLSLSSSHGTAMHALPSEFQGPRLGKGRRAQSWYYPNGLLPRGLQDIAAIGFGERSFAEPVQRRHSPARPDSRVQLGCR